MSTTWAQREGAVVDGQFQLGSYLGGSGRSAVFRTRAGDHDAAIKLIPADSQDAELRVARWKRAVNLSHPHLIRLYRTGRCQVGGTPMLYAVMELADENLAEILPDRALTGEEARDMLDPVLDALAYLHRQGFAHGRLKPTNIMATGDKLKLASDGLLPLGEFAQRREKPGAYDPPEIGTRGNAPAADIWSLGMTLVETLTQRLPVRDAKAQEDPTLPGSLPVPFDEIARRALRWNPEARCTIADIRSILHPAALAATAVAAAAPSAAAPAKPSPTPAARAVAPATPTLVKQPAKRAASAPRKPTSQRSYAAFGIIAALILAAVLIGPRLFERRQPASQAPQTANTETPSPTPAPHATAAVAQPAPPAETAKPEPRPPAPVVEKAESNPPAPAPAARTANARPAANSKPPVNTAANSQVLNQVMPEVSQKARDTIQGKVRVSVKVQVDPSGAVSDATLNSPGPSKYFADRALDAAWQWTFTPVTAAGQSVASEWILRFDFHPNDTKVVPTRISP